jgi:predicted RNA binding protein YcfA (HicA-like mRNA interferase family)
MAGIHAERMIRTLERLGWRVVRSKGSHHALANANRPGVITVPVHKGRTLPERIARNILKQAGIDEDTFLESYR